VNDPITMIIDRLPVTYVPPFDCINDNASCPICKKRRSSHGVSGSIAIFAVRTEREGKRYAVTLQVLGGDYLPITRQWWHAQGLKPEPPVHKAADLTIHCEHSHGIIDCTILGDGRRCRPNSGFLAAEILFNAHGSRDGTVDVREQPEALWAALERYLVEELFGTTGGAS
jgi:hypothetical protein